jgi:hypothetical protein
MISMLLAGLALGAAAILAGRWLRLTYGDRRPVLAPRRVVVPPPGGGPRRVRRG